MKKFALLFSLFFASLSVAAAPIAADFTLKDSTGASHTLSQYHGKIVVLEWFNPECPFVKRHYKSGTMKKLAAEFQPKGVVWLGINSSHFWNEARAKEWAAEQKLPYPILDDSRGEVGKSFGAKTTPHMFIINKDGAVAYQGAIDDDSSGDNVETHNYVRAVLDELIADKAVSVAETKSYGCSVKYR